MGQNKEKKRKGIVASLFPKLHYMEKRMIKRKRENEKEGNAEAHCVIGRGDYHVA